MPETVIQTNGLRAIFMPVPTADNIKRDTDGCWSITHATRRLSPDVCLQCSSTRAREALYIDYDITAYRGIPITVIRPVYGNLMSCWYRRAAKTNNNMVGPQVSIFWQTAVIPSRFHTPTSMYYLSLIYSLCSGKYDRDVIIRICTCSRTWRSR